MRQSILSRRMWVAAWGLLAVASMTATAPAADWGDLSARFVLNGTAPAPKPISVTKDPEFCGKFGLVDEQLVVNPTNKGIANVVVFLYVAPTGKQPPIHDSYKESEKAEVRIDNKSCRFEPHIVPLWTTQTLVAGNLDSVGHNTNITTTKNPPQNVLIPSNGALKLNFPAAEVLPAAPVSCNIHPWMKAYVVIKSHPYIAVSDADGKVSLKNVPAGKWTFQFWHESGGYLTKLKMGGKEMNWSRGRPDLEIKKGMNDLGDLQIDATSFKLQ